MYYRGYNDYELLYLIKEKNEIALEIMFKKYEKFIYKKIHSIKITKYDFEDLVQEGHNVLLKAIDKYNEFENKTFMRFFEMLLEHRLIDILRKDIKDKYYYQLQDDYIQNYRDNNATVLEQEILKETQNINYQNMSETEQYVYESYYLKNMKVCDIAINLNTESRNVSNTIQRIKRKIHLVNKKNSKH